MSARFYQVFGPNYQAGVPYNAHLKCIAHGNPAGPKEENAMFKTLSPSTKIVAAGVLAAAIIASPGITRPAAAIDAERNQRIEAALNAAGCQDKAKRLQCIRLVWSFLTPAEREGFYGLCTWDPRLPGAENPTITTDNQYWSQWRLLSAETRTQLQKMCDGFKEAKVFE